MAEKTLDGSSIKPVTYVPGEMPEEIRRMLEHDLEFSGKMMLLDSELQHIYSDKLEWLDAHAKILSESKLKVLILHFVKASEDTVNQEMLNKIPAEFQDLALRYLELYKLFSGKQI